MSRRASKGRQVPRNPFVPLTRHRLAEIESGRAAQGLAGALLRRLVPPPNGGRRGVGGVAPDGDAALDQALSISRVEPLSSPAEPPSRPDQQDCAGTVQPCPL